MRNLWLIGMIGCLVFWLASSLVAQPFTFQGMLKQNGQPVNGTVVMTFRLYDVSTGGNQIGSPITQTVSVQNGLFTVALDLGAVWTGADRYLEIQVGSTTLSPRVKVTATPYAMYALKPWEPNGSALFYNGGNVGIGTNSPAARLSLGSSTAATKLALWQGNATGQIMGLGVGAGQFRLHLNNYLDRFSFLNAPNGNELVTIQGDGKVGIGTSSPAARLSLGGGNADTKLALWQGNTASEMMGLGIWPAQFRLHLSGSGDRFSFLNAPNGNELVTIKGDGKVGIGTNNPAARLHIVGGNLRVDNGEIQNRGWIVLHPDVDGINGDKNVHIKNGSLTVGGNYFAVGGGDDPFRWRRVEVKAVSSGTSWVGTVQTFGGNLSTNVYLTYPTINGDGYPNHGVVAVFDSAGNGKASMLVDNHGTGVLTAQIKSFRVPDPEDATRDIWYGCLEGPELAMYVRGTARLVNGRARIELPDHFRKLADEQGITVQLTPLSPESKGLCVVRKGLDGIEVVELLNGRGNYEFDWEVKAVRAEHRDFEVYRSWDYLLPGGMERSEAWEARLKSIEARQARQRTQSQARAPEGGKAR